jgi:hypothetical protein
MDFCPLVLLFAISVTGWRSPRRRLWLRGSLLRLPVHPHAITVITALLYLPFGSSSTSSSARPSSA